MAGGDRTGMKTEVRGHVVVVVVVAVALAVVDAEDAGDVEDVEPIEDGVVAGRNRTVVDRLVQPGAVGSVDVVDHDRQQPLKALTETFPSWPDVLIQEFLLGNGWDHHFL
jgi:hypothetical protein